MRACGVGRRVQRVDALCVRVSMCARVAAPSGMWQLLAPGVRRSWLRVGLCSRTISGSLLLVHTQSPAVAACCSGAHYISVHRSSAAVAPQ